MRRAASTDSARLGFAASVSKFAHHLLERRVLAPGPLLEPRNDAFLKIADDDLAHAAFHNGPCQNA
jgi:hypothetical protein